MSGNPRCYPGSDEPHSRETSILASSSRDSLRASYVATRSQSLNFTKPTPDSGVADSAHRGSGPSDSLAIVSTADSAEFGQLPLLGAELLNTPDSGVTVHADSAPDGGLSLTIMKSEGLKIGLLNISSLNR